MSINSSIDFKKSNIWEGSEEEDVIVKLHLFNRRERR